MNDELLIHVAVKLARLNANVTALSGLLNVKLNEPENREFHKKLVGHLLDSEVDFLCQQFPDLEKQFREQAELQVRNVSEGLRERGPGSAERQ